METTGTVQNDKTLERYGLKNVTVNWNLSPEELQKITVEKAMKLLNIYLEKKFMQETDMFVLIQNTEQILEQ